MKAALEIKDMTREFRNFKLGPVDLMLEQGYVMALVGPNGAGKTTTLQTVMGLLKQDSGTINVYGRETHPNKIDWKFDIGYVGAEHAFFENWTCKKNLKFISEFYPAWNNDYATQLVKRLDLDLNAKAKELSSGNRTKLAVVTALAHQPKLLLLDEPTSGLDPVVRTELLNLLFEYMEPGDRSILYSTHILSDLSRLADMISFIRDGKIIGSYLKDDLIESWGRINCRCDDDLSGIEAKEVKRENGRWYITSDNAKEIEAELKTRGCENINIERLSLNDISVQILKEKEAISTISKLD